MCSGMDRISCTTRTYDGHIFKKNGNWYQSFLLAPKDFKLYGFPIFDYDENYFRNASCTLNEISTLLLNKYKNMLNSRWK